MSKQRQNTQKYLEKHSGLSHPIVDEVEEDKDGNTTGCQGCGGQFENASVMIVDEVGPVCFNCLYFLAYRYLK